MRSTKKSLRTKQKNARTTNSGLDAKNVVVRTVDFGLDAKTVEEALFVIRKEGNLSVNSAEAVPSAHTNDGMRHAELVVVVESVRIIDNGQNARM